MKIASFNINNVNRRLPNLLAWLDAAKPDVVCLQELKAAQDAFPEAAIAEAGYGAVWRGQKSWNGVAILARGAAPVLTRNALPGDPSAWPSRYIEAAVGGVLIGCLYLPNGNPQPGPKFDYKLDWMRRLQARAAELQKNEIPTVLAGDYNVIPTRNDIWSASAMLDDALRQPESIAAYRTLLGQGWTDALATHYPQGGIWTYWDFQAGAWQRDHGFRIDHLLLSPAIADRLMSCGVDKEHRGREKASDHAPTWIELE
jgi:exodeoxyribonuclease-3